MFKASVFSRTKLIVLIRTVSPNWLFRLFAVEARSPAETGPFKRPDDNDLDDSTAQPVLLLTLRVVSSLEGVSPPRTVSDALAQPREWLARWRS